MHLILILKYNNNYKLILYVLNITILKCFTIFLTVTVGIFLSCLTSELIINYIIKNRNLI